MAAAEGGDTVDRTSEIVQMVAMATTL